MTGKTLKEKIKEKGMSFSEVAKRIGTTPQNMEIIFRGRNVKTETVESVAEAIGEPVSYFYNEYPILSVEDYARVRFMEQEIVYLRQLIIEKDNQITLLKEQKKGK